MSSNEPTTCMLARECDCKEGARGAKQVKFADENQSVLQPEATTQSSGLCPVPSERHLCEHRLSLQEQSSKVKDVEAGGRSVRNLTRQVLKVIENISVKEKDSKCYSKVTSDLESLVMKQMTQSRVARIKIEPYPTTKINPVVTSTPLSTLWATATMPPGLSLKDRFKTELCRKFMENTTCPYGKKCQFAHGYHELRPVNRHPRYRTELCREFFTHGLCTYGARCNFIHVSPEGEQEANIDQNQADKLLVPSPQLCSYSLNGQQQVAQVQQTSEFFERPFTPEQDSGLCLSSISPISASLSPDTADGLGANDQRFFSFENRPRFPQAEQNNLYARV